MIKSRGIPLSYLSSFEYLDALDSRLSFNLICFGHETYFFSIDVDADFGKSVDCTNSDAVVWDLIWPNHSMAVYNHKTKMTGDDFIGSGAHCPGLNLMELGI